MAVEKMNKLSLTFQADHLENVLELMQCFQGVHIESGFESTIPPDRKALLDKEIREIEKSLQEIQSASNVLKGRESTNLFSSLKNAEEKELTIPELDKIVTQSNWSDILTTVIKTDRWLQNNRLIREEIIKNRNALEIWQKLSHNPLDFKRLKRTTAVYGSLHPIHLDEFIERLGALTEDGVACEVVCESEERVYCLILYHNSVGDKVQLYINEFSFSQEEYPFDKPQAEMEKEFDAKEAQLLEDEHAIDRQIVEQEQYKEILALAEDYNLNLLLRKKKSLEVTYMDDQVAIKGWILESKRTMFERCLSQRIPKSDYELIISPVRDRDIDDVPIKLKNNKLVTIYERLTMMYSLPRYNEIDPTPVMTVFYLLLFGMMVADAGYGLAIFLVGLVVRKFLKIKRDTKSLIDFLFYLSFPIMGWGLVYGSFFGTDLPFRLVTATVDVIPLTILSLIIGYIHIMTGLVLHTMNQIKLKKYYDMLNGSLSWIVGFLGGGLMIAGKMIPVAGLDILFNIGSVLLAAGLLMIILVPAIQYKKRWYAGIGKGLYSLYGATSYFGDFVSYTRLMALGVAGGSVAMAFNTILGFLPFAAKITIGVILAIVLHLLNIFLTMLSAYVHGIRLQFIEFFGKFYTGGGRPFEPFKAAEKNIIIKDETVSSGTGG